VLVVVSYPARWEVRVAVSSSHWDRLVQVLEERGVLERGRLLESDEPPARPSQTSTSAGDLQVWERARWIPVISETVARSVVGIHERLLDVHHYGLDTDTLVDFITMTGDEAVQQVQRTEERLWRELADEVEVIHFDRVKDYPVLDRNDSARTGIHLARLVRDTLHALDLPAAVSELVGSASPTASGSGSAGDGERALVTLARARQMLAEFLYRPQGELSLPEVVSRLSGMMDGLARSLDTVWSERIGLLDDQPLEVSVGTTGATPTLWDVEIGAMVQHQDEVAQAVEQSASVMTAVVGVPASMALFGAAAGIGALRTDIPESDLVTPRMDVLRGEVDPVWAGRLLAQFGRERVYRIRATLIRLRALVTSLLRLAVINVRKVSVDWDSLVTETVFRSRVHEWRRSLVVFFVRQIVSVLDELIEVLQFAEYLGLDEVGEWMAPLAEEALRFSSRVAQVVREHFYEQTIRRRAVIVQFRAEHERIRQLIRLRVILDRWIGVLDEVLALPVVAPTLSAAR